jgi:2-oxoglutarate ferredoxin oxidoreductase subunit alpha
MPTKHGQDDLLAAAFGSHGDYQKIIVAPTNVSDCIYTTIHAFNLAERYQCPVIILSDSALASMKETIDKPDFSSVKIENRKILRSWDRDEPYLRFKPTSSGIESIPVPGESPLTYRITGMEHGQDSTPVKTPAAREEQMRKRFEKLSMIEQENEMLLKWDLESTDVYDVDFSIIAWGLTASIARESVKRLRAKGYKVAALYPQLLFPVCVNAIHKLLRFSSKLFIPEANYTGQLANLIRMSTDAKPVKINISRGEPFTPEEIEQRILELINKK